MPRSVMSPKHQRAGYLFIAPAMVLFLIYILYPIFSILRGSLFRWDGINEKVFLGFTHYREIFTGDRIFRLAMRNSLYWAVLAISIQMIIGFAFAYILNHNLRGRNIPRAIFYLPAIISPVVIGIVWQRIYNPFGGLLSDIGYRTGLSFLAQPYLSEPRTAVFSVITVNIWQWTGYSMLMILAGMQSIPDEVHQSVKIEGASRFQEIRYILWPMVRGVRTTLILLGIIGTLQTFDLVFALTNGGPNHATQMPATYIYLKAFRLQSMGYGSALSSLTVALALLLSVVQIKGFGAKFSLDN